MIMIAFFHRPLLNLLYFCTLEKEKDLIEEHLAV
jgi:hypothetical protein